MGKTGNEQRLKVVLRIRNNGGWEEFDHQERKLQRVRKHCLFFSLFADQPKEKAKEGEKTSKEQENQKS